MRRKHLASTVLIRRTLGPYQSQSSRGVRSECYQLRLPSNLPPSTLLLLAASPRQALYRREVHSDKSHLRNENRGSVLPTPRNRGREKSHSRLAHSQAVGIPSSVQLRLSLGGLLQPSVSVLDLYVPLLGRGSEMGRKPQAY